MPASLRVQLYFPPEEVHQLGPITVQARSSDYNYGSVTYKEGGPHEFVVTVPAEALITNILPVTFCLNKYLPASKTDPRDLGTVVTSIRLENE